MCAASTRVVCRVALVSDRQGMRLPASVMWTAATQQLSQAKPQAPDKSAKKVLAWCVNDRDRCITGGPTKNE